MTAPPPAFDLSPERMESLGIRHALDPNPFLELPTEEDLLDLCGNIDELVEFLRPRHLAIHRQLHDPLFNGYEPVSWARARQQLAELRQQNPHGVIWLVVQGGWRSSKSEFAAKICLEVLTRASGRRMWAMQQTEQASRERQHSYLYRYIPARWRPAKGKTSGRKSNTHINYADGPGFSGEYFILPNGGDCRFKYYASAIESLQGAELDVAWLDELAPMEHVENVEGRLGTRNGFGILTFTPINGYSATVGAFLSNARTVLSTDADLLPQYGKDHEFLGFEKVPLVVHCTNRLRRVVYFHTSENFYGGAETIRKTLEQKTRSEKLIKFYGVAERRTGSVFTNWNDEINIMGEAGVQSVLANAAAYTWYHVYDPAGARNPYMQWWAVSALGQCILMREWPQEGDYIPTVGSEKGVWALTGDTDDGTRGPGQTNFGLGTRGISREVERIERELAAKIPPPRSGPRIERIVPRERWMDSRAASAPNQTSGRSVTLIEIYEELKPEEDGTERKLLFEKASGRQANADGENWMQVIQDMLVVNEMTTAPGMIVACHCTNFIFSMKTWTGNDGGEGACKDPIDAGKYFALGEHPYVDPKPPHPADGDEWTGYGRRRQ